MTHKTAAHLLLHGPKGQPHHGAHNRRLGGRRKLQQLAQQQLRVPLLQLGGSGGRRSRRHRSKVLPQADESLAQQPVLQAHRQCHRGLIQAHCEGSTDRGKARAVSGRGVL